jgi:hypothetical protein
MRGKIRYIQRIFGYIFGYTGATLCHHCHPLSLLDIQHNGNKKVVTGVGLEPTLSFPNQEFPIKVTLTWRHNQLGHPAYKTYFKQA